MCAIDTCEPKPIVLDSDQTYGDDLVSYGPDYTLIFEQCESNTKMYHIAPNHKTGHWVVYDFGCEVAVQQVVLRNTRNRGHNDR